MDKKNRLLKILKALQIIFYLLFLILWFKDNFLPLKRLPISYLFALIPLTIILLLRLFLWLQAKKIKIQFKLQKSTIVLFLILLLATIVRIPFFVHNYGLMDSDEAIPALQGKHIAEGKQPALYYYGAYFQGSLPQHYYALMFKIFGYSIFALKLAAHLAFLGFLSIQFFLLKEIFSFEFASVMGLFYLLPLPYLVASSFDIGSGFPIVLLFGSLIISLTYLIWYKGKEEGIPSLAFLLGLAFWTHQISIIFILTSCPFLILKLRFELKKYFTILLFFLVGAFPLLMNEVFRKFPIVRVLFLGQSGTLNWAKVVRAKKLMLSLISSGPPYLDFLYLLLIFLGLAVLLFLSLRSQKGLPSLLFVVYFIAFMGVYLLSNSSAANIIRYLYILYLVLPVLLGSAFFFIKTKIKYLAMAAFFLFLFLASSWKASSSNYLGVKERHLQIKEVIHALEETGNRYWRGDYWISYLVNAISKENLIVASYTVERYSPYSLAYYSEGNNNNWIFDVEDEKARMLATNLTKLLEQLKVEHKRKEVNRFSLLYDIKSNVFPKNLFSTPPESIPEVNLERIESAEGILKIYFAMLKIIPTGGFRLTVEIPEFSLKFLALPQKDKFSVKIPCPSQENIKIKYYLSFAGLTIRSTVREIDYTTPKMDLLQKRNRLEYLSGLGPRREIFQKKLLVCQKESRFLLDTPLKDSSRISFYLYSPFDFDDPFWYGDYFQEVSIFVNESFLTTMKMKDGKNVLAIHCPHPPFNSGENIIRLEFKYASLVSFNDLWKTSAYLEKITIE